MKKQVIALGLISTMFLGGCASQGMTGGMMGGSTGAAIGAMTSKNKLLGGAIGLGAGALLGYIIGNELDKNDLRKASKALETQPSGTSTTWHNADSGKSFVATPMPAYTGSNGSIYRDLIITTNTGEQIRVKAMRNYDGTWSIVN